MNRWWWDRSERVAEDEQAVADLRTKMERIMAQLESTIEEMRGALEEEDGMGEGQGEGGGGDGEGQGEGEGGPARVESAGPNNGGGGRSESDDTGIRAD